MTTFDRLDWHLDAALERRRPPENAFTHIGLYLAWLLRHDLLDPTAIPADVAAGVHAGELPGSALRDAVDDSLTAATMTPDGAAFTEWYYPQYLDDVAVAFADAADYGVSDTAASYARMAPTIDRRYTEWLATSATPDAGTASGLTFSGDVLRDLSPDELDAMARELADAIAGPSAADDQAAADEQAGDDGYNEALNAHDAPDLEALLPAQILGTPLLLSSARASEWQSALLRGAIANVGGDPADSFVALGLGGMGPETIAVTLYAIPGVPQDRLEAEFSSDAYLPPGQHWEPRDVDGKSVWWSTAEEFDTAFYALGGLVVTVGGSPDRVRAALEVLP